MKNFEIITEEEKEILSPQFTVQKSFYDKAYLIIKSNLYKNKESGIIEKAAINKIDLYSYNTKVLEIYLQNYFEETEENNNEKDLFFKYNLNYKIEKKLLFSSTTLKHIKETLKKYGLAKKENLNKKYIIENNEKAFTKSEILNLKQKGTESNERNFKRKHQKILNLSSKIKKLNKEIDEQKKAYYNFDEIKILNKYNKEQFEKLTEEEKENTRAEYRKKQEESREILDRWNKLEEKRKDFTLISEIYKKNIYNILTYYKNNISKIIEENAKTKSGEIKNIGEKTKNKIAEEIKKFLNDLIDQKEKTAFRVYAHFNNYGFYDYKINFSIYLNDLSCKYCNDIIKREIDLTIENGALIIDKYSATESPLIIEKENISETIKTIKKNRQKAEKLFKQFEEIRDLNNDLIRKSFYNYENKDLYIKWNRLETE